MIELGRKESVEQIAKALASIVGESNVETANPASGTSGEYRILANVTAFPGTETEIAEIMKYAHSAELTVVPQGGGTKDAFGLLNQQPDILLSLRRLTGIVDHPAGDMTVTVLPGTTVSRLQQELAKYQQFLPVDPAWPEDATIGGVISANTTGPKRALYGSPRDLVLGARVVYPDGTIIRTGAKTVKNVAGYDMNKLFIGAMGTLGIITELTFKVRPMAKYTANVIVSHQRAEDLMKLQLEVLDSYLEPTAMEFVNPTLIHQLGLDVPQSHALIFAFEDVEKSVGFQVDWLTRRAALLGLNVTAVQEQDKAKAFWNKYVNLLPNSLHADAQKCVVSLKISCLLTQMKGLLDAIESAAIETGISVLAMGGGATGLGRIVTETGHDHQRAVIQWIERSMEIVSERKGHLIIEFAPQSIRSKLSVWGKERADFTLMRGIKAKIDPLWILNPGRFAGGI